MTTPSSSTVEVLGVLVDPVFLCHQTVSSSETVGAAVDNLWEAFNKPVDENPTSEIPYPSFVQVLLDTNLESAGTTFSALTLKNPQEEYTVLFGMPSSWSYDAFSRGNKENVVAGMANLSITDDEGNRKLTGGSNKPNVPRCTDSSPLPLVAAPHNNTIESLRQELLVKINGQGNEIRALKSSNAELKSSNAELKSSNAELKSANAELTSKVKEVISSNAELTSKVYELTSSNTNLLERVHKLAASNSDMSTTLQRHTRTLYALNRRTVLDDARNKLAIDYNFSLDELRPRRSDVSPLVQQIQSRLNIEHAKLLSYDALTMIFDSSDDSMRDSGNKAAHESPLADRVDSVLEATLTKTQRALLGKIYYFAHGKEPDFEGAA